MSCADCNTCVLVCTYKYKNIEYNCYIHSKTTIYTEGKEYSGQSLVLLAGSTNNFFKQLITDDDPCSIAAKIALLRGLTTRKTLKDFKKFLQT